MFVCVRRERERRRCVHMLLCIYIKHALMLSLCKKIAFYCPPLHISAKYNSSDFMFIPLSSPSHITTLTTFTSFISFPFFVFLFVCYFLLPARRVIRTLLKKENRSFSNIFIDWGLKYFILFVMNIKNSKWNFFI